MSIVRYRYRAYPTEGQVQAPARTFGCARVVYNDCLWTCPGCGAEHDRDLNAARNVLAEGRRIAAGLADAESGRSSTTTELRERLRAWRSGRDEG